jgi:hypothetical protein
MRGNVFIPEADTLICVVLRTPVLGNSLVPLNVNAIDEVSYKPRSLLPS